MARATLAENQQYVEDNAERLLNIYRNKFILVVDREVVGSYDTFAAAANDGVTTYGIRGDFLVHQVLEKAPINFVMSARL